MRHLAAAIRVEAFKVRRSRLILISVLVAVVFPLLIGLVLTGAADVHSPVVVEQTPLGYLAQYQTVIAIGGLIGFGFLFSWIFGREYADRTITDLLALPVPRTHVVLAKFLVAVVWCTVLSVLHFAVGCLFTWQALKEPMSADLIAAAFGRYLLTALMVIALSTPVAWVASVSRDYLTPLGFVVLTIALAQLLGALGIAAYFPWAVPALFSGIVEGAAFKLNAISLLLPLVIGIAGVAATLLHWRYADQT